MAIKKNPVTNFKRVEKKFLLSQEQYDGIMAAIADRIRPDEYGESTICNIYYDTPDFELIRNSIEKPVYKEKLRLRSYGIPTMDSTVFLEIKKKYKKVVYKRRSAMTLRQAETYLAGGEAPPIDNINTLREFDFFLKRYDLRPALYLAYDRQSYYSVEDDTLRITFDRRIRSRTTDISLAKGDHGELLLPEDMHLMEVKVSGALPLWLAHVMAELKIFPTSFSKYGRVYAKSVLASRR